MLRVWTITQRTSTASHRAPSTSRPSPAGPSRRRGALRESRHGLGPTRGNRPLTSDGGQSAGSKAPSLTHYHCVRALSLGDVLERLWSGSERTERLLKRPPGSELGCHGTIHKPLPLTDQGGVLETGLLKGRSSSTVRAVLNAALSMDSPYPACPPDHNCRTGCHRGKERRPRRQGGLSPHHRPPPAPCCPSPDGQLPWHWLNHAGVEGTEARRQAGTGTAPGQ